MWEVARKNRRKSMILLSLMGVILVGMGFIMGAALTGEEGGAVFGILVALLLYFILLLIAFAGGKSIMLKMGNAKEVGPDEYPQLYNIVEEMRLAAGMPFTPKVYVIHDPAPNAFAAGMTPKNSVVAVTTGLLDMMNRDELQGVIAHEISHIINRDIRYMTIATIMVAAVAIMSQVFVRAMFYSGGGRSRSSGKGGGQAQIIMLVVALAFAILAPILIRLLYFALSRKREYLADASGARLTRYPEGLASALEKIGNSTLDLSGAGKANAPMYIANPLKPKGRKLKNMSSTHPPLENRIKILRAMGNGYSFANYQQAYQAVTNRRSSLIPSSAIASDQG
jgi:heat shock protein HtpX